VVIKYDLQSAYKNMLKIHIGTPPTFLYQLTGALPNESLNAKAGVDNV